MSKRINEIEVVCDYCRDTTLLIGFLEHREDGAQQDAEISERIKEAGWDYYENILDRFVDICPNCRLQKEK